MVVLPHSKKVLKIQLHHLAMGLSVWRLHVLPIFAWVFFRYASFHSPNKKGVSHSVSWKLSCSRWKTTVLKRQDERDPLGLREDRGQILLLYPTTKLLLQTHRYVTKQENSIVESVALINCMQVSLKFNLLQWFSLSVFWKMWPLKFASVAYY